MTHSIAHRVRALRAQCDELGVVEAIGFKASRLWDRVVGHKSAYQLRSRRASHPVWIRPATSDLAVFHQIFIEREYRCLDDLKDVSFVIDCGANVGMSAVYLLSRYPDATLVAIEPEAGNYNSLVRNTAAFGSRVRCVNAGVWSHSAGLMIDRDTKAARAEWAFTVREAGHGEQPDVAAIDVTSVWEAAGCPKISILKMDIEGSEAAVFSATDKPWLARVENLVIELHGDHCEKVVRSAIEGLGFSVSTCGELTVCRRRV